MLCLGEDQAWCGGETAINSLELPWLLTVGACPSPWHWSYAGGGGVDDRWLLHCFVFSMSLSGTMLAGDKGKTEVQAPALEAELLPLPQCRAAA